MKHLRESVVRDLGPSRASRGWPEFVRCLWIRNVVPTGGTQSALQKTTEPSDRSNLKRGTVPHLSLRCLTTYTHAGRRRGEESLGGDTLRSTAFQLTFAPACTAEKRAKTALEWVRTINLRFRSTVRPAMPEPADQQLRDVRRAILQLNLALDRREHGDVAQWQCVNRIRRALGMDWHQGETTRLLEENPQLLDEA